MKSFSIFFWRKIVATYNTQQKKELMDFLKKHPERSYTAEENLVKRFAGSRGTKAAYQIMGGESCHFHIHLKCTNCGRLLHMSDEDSHMIAENLLKSVGFALDLGRTTLFGLCEGCRTKGNHA